ncbi:MAG: SDR family oxidoreductase [Ferrimicrobium sp.]
MVQQRNVVVTGGSRGIGLAIGEKLAAQGYGVVLVARKQDELEDACSDILTSVPGAQVCTVVANVGQLGAAQVVFDQVEEVFGGIDVLVNNAATNPYYGPLVDIPVEAMDKLYQVNLRAPLLFSQEFARRYRVTERSGSIVNIASIGGMAVEAGIGWYNVAKAGLIHLTRHLAYELGPAIRVNSVSPGLVRTQFARTLWESHESKLSQRLPIKRIGEPRDIAQAVAFLVSDEAAWMTGENLVIDGGNLASPMF